MADLTEAIDRYNSYGYQLFMDTPAFNRLVSARNRAFRKKILLVNLRGATINAHLERVFVRAVSARGKDLALDIFHSFDESYRSFGVANPTGFRIKYSGLDNLRDFVARTVYDAVLFVDLPYWEQGFMPYIWLAMGYKAREKHFIANDNLLSAGHLFAVDLAQKVRVFDAFSTACVINQHSVSQWARFGRPRNGFMERDYAMDCRYYEPSKSVDGDYILSCGRADRNFSALFGAVEGLGPGVKLKIYTEAPLAVPVKLKKRVEIVPYSADCAGMKELVAGAAFVTLPVEGSAMNPGAGLSVALLSMAMGKVVLTLGNPCVHRYLKDGHNAFTYGKLSAPELARGMRRILSLSAAEKARVGKNARKTALKRNDMNPFVEKYLDALLKKI